MRSITGIGMATMISLLIGTAWAQGNDPYEKLAAARQRLRVRVLRSAVVSFYRTLDNDDLDAAKTNAGKIQKLWDALDSDLQKRIDTGLPGTSQRVADLESECQETAAPAAASQPAAPAAAKSGIKALPASRPAAKSDDSAAPPSIEIVRMGESPAGSPKLDERRSGPITDTAGKPAAAEPWRPKYANDFDIFGDHPKGRCEKYKGAAEEPTPPPQPATPAVGPAAKTAPPRNNGDSIDQIIKTTPAKAPPKKKK